MGTQEIIVFAILFLCIGWIGTRIYHSFKKIEDGKSPCSGCTSDCSLKHESTKSREEKKKNGVCM